MYMKCSNGGGTVAGLVIFLIHFVLPRTYTFLCVRYLFPFLFTFFYVGHAGWNITRTEQMCSRTLCLERYLNVLIDNPLVDGIFDCTACAWG